jgi:hypothetical protein
MTINVKQYLSKCYPEEELLIIDGFDEAFIGVGYQFHNLLACCYDKDKIILALIRDGMTFEEALEHFEFNIAGAWVGERTPIIIETPDTDDSDEEDL